ncbi:MAG TPA: protein phosphatase 2C domain-containing protein, partial [Agitococcus sp.]|nr:protein phosphatase 2C domain-containing protein [Agitococcus sp.]
MANKTRQRKKAADLGTTSEATTALPTTIESSLPTTTPLVLAETNQFVAIDSSAITTAEQSENTTNSAVTLTEDTPLVVPTVIEQFNNWCLANHQWSVMAEAVVGLTHRDKNLPCQDAVACQTVPRTCLVVCDGAGSSVLSELGANALCQGLTLLCHSLEALWHDLLDNEATNDSLLNTLTRIVLRHAK